MEDKIQKLSQQDQIIPKRWKASLQLRTGIQVSKITFH